MPKKIACCVLHSRRILFCKQNETFFMLDNCCHLTLCLQMLKPHYYFLIFLQDSTYMKMKHKSFIAAGQPTRTTVQLNTVVNAYKPVANHAGNIAHEKLKKIEGKKSRDDKERVLETLFGLFEKHQYYNIKDLAKGTKQPITYLKEILNEVCHYNVKNPHKNMWELKPEYRHYKAKPEEETKNDGDDSSDDD